MTAEPAKQTSALYKGLRSLYFAFAGTPTNRNIFNFKYLTTYRLHADLKKELSQLHGSVLDFGCGQKPYQSWFKKTDDYIGLDIYPGPQVDFVVTGGKIQISGRAFDCALATQVFEHTDSLEYLREINRLLKPGGTLVISVPFLYHIHEQRDFRRFTKQGLINTLSDYDFETERVYVQGGIGSTLTIMKFYFIDDLVRNRLPGWAKIIISPLIVFWLVIVVPIGNILGFLLDKIDNTERFYNNLLVVAHKK